MPRVKIKSMKNDSTFEVDIDVETGRYVAAVLLDKDEDVIVTVKDIFMLSTLNMCRQLMKILRVQQN